MLKFYLGYLRSFEMITIKTISYFYTTKKYKAKVLHKQLDTCITIY